jgi:tetratricopeptide (TPR) repeat protein
VVQERYETLRQQKSRSATRCGMSCRSQIDRPELILMGLHFNLFADEQQCVRSRRRTGNHRMRTADFFVWIATVAIATAATATEPYIPAEDNAVLETLPRGILSGQDELATLRRQLADDPTNIELAVGVASGYLKIGKSQGDPRFYGYARAAIGPWWKADGAPPEILRLRAKLKERNHQYDEALADLRLLVEQQPQDVQAWIELANIYRVQGKYAEALQACDRLEGFAGATPTIMARVPIQAVTGKAEEAYASLSNVLPMVRENYPSAVQWIVTMQAEIARALGHDREAELHYVDGLASDPADFYLLRSYGDYLLDHGREEEVLSLLREHVSDTGILLLAAIAARRGGTEVLAAEWTAQLKSRFEETRLRGDLPHGKFEARYELELMDDPPRALAIAEANWQQQKDPRDSRNFLEAAIAAKEPDRARPVLEFLEKSGTQDVDLKRLARQLEGH